MRVTLAILIAAGLCAGASGCRVNNKQLVETDLRDREIEVRELREELQRCDAYNKALQLDIRASRGELFNPQVPDGPTMVYPLRALTLGRQTGGRELDGDGSGDNALQVVLEPRDGEKQTIKVPCSALIQAAEITAEGIKRPLSSWEIPPETMRNQWRAGLLTTGFVLVLPWKNPPMTEHLRITATLRLPDGRAFEADKDITIRLPVGMRSRPMPPADAPPMPGPAIEGPLLPGPRIIDESPRAPAPNAPWWSLKPTQGTQTPTVPKPWWETLPKKTQDAALGQPQPRSTDQR